MARFGRTLWLTLVVLLVGCAPAPRSFPHAFEQVPQVQVPPVVLEAAGGRLVTPSSFPGRWVWLYLGYTNCPDICPTALSFLAEARKRLVAPSQVQVVFVSVDPGRDTPAKLAQHVTYFDPTFIGVTGTRHALDVLAGALGARYELGVATRPGGGYTVNHTNVIYVLDPQGRLTARYAPEGDPAAIATDFNRLGDRLATR
jgi:protein SCO1/2